MNDVPNSVINNATEENAVEHKFVQCTLLYAGKKGESIVKELTKSFKRHLLKTRFASKAKQHLHKVVYEGECPDCDKKYIGETGRRIEERFKEHAGKDHSSHV